MNDDDLDQILADWLREGPDRGRVDALDRALAATRRTSQRPGWRQPTWPARRGWGCSTDSFSMTPAPRRWPWRRGHRCRARPRLGYR